MPDAKGLAYYNTLKARGVDARLLWFPDENHWVLKPANSRQWHQEVHAWLARHGAEGGPVGKAQRAAGASPGASRRASAVSAAPRTVRPQALAGHRRRA